MQQRDRFFVLTAGLMAFFFLCSFQIPILGHKKKKYETPITKDTLQPDKILFDRAIHDIEHGNYEVARLTLNTLINTYDTSEYLAKAKLAIADSWYREGGPHGLASAEAEYKDFILFYPNMEEAAQSQFRVCDIHYKQMDKADRDSAQAQRAEDECRQVTVQFPNSKYVPQSQQMLRDVQEVLADKEFITGEYYHKKGSFPAAANRLNYVTQQYPLFSGSDDALWDLADSYRHMGERFRSGEGDALTKIVRDYPLSGWAAAAKDRLKTLELPIPQADPAALARMKFESEHVTRPNMLHRTIGIVAGRPDTSPAAKSGAPIMTSIKPPTPVSVPEPAGAVSGVSDVAISASNDSTALDQKPDARLGVSGAAAPGGAQGGAQGAPAAAAPATTADATPAATPVGADEHKASVGSNGQNVAALAPVAPLGASRSAAAALAAPVTAQVAPPTNHPLTKAQQAEQKRQAAKQLKALKKQTADAVKKYGISTTPAPAATTTPATTTPSATTTPAPATTAPRQ